MICITKPNTCIILLIELRMSRTLQFSNNYAKQLQYEQELGLQSTYSSIQSFPFTAFTPAQKIQIEINADELSKLTLEAESYMIKLQDRLGQDDIKKDKIFQELDQIAQDIEAIQKTMPEERDIERLFKPCKQAIKGQFADCKRKLEVLGHRLGNQFRKVSESVEDRDRQYNRQKVERDGGWLRMIDEFQADVLEVEELLVAFRNRQQQIFEEIEVKLYNLEMSTIEKIDKQSQIRESEHQTITALITQCIEHIHP